MRRLTPALLTMVMFGVVGLLVMAYVAKNLLARDEAPRPPSTRNIPMGIADIPAGTFITENHIGMGPFPVEKLDRDMLLVNRVIVGRIAKEEIKAAQPIRANQLFQPGELPSLSTRVGPGMRAVTIDVSDSGAMVDGLVKPGEYVDVLFTYGAASNDDAFQGGLTMRLFEGVKVIAYNRNLQQGRLDRSSNNVTLELTEPQTNIITLAKGRGQLTLSYNPNGAGDGGLALSNTERVTLYEILGLKPQEEAPEPFMAEIYRGTGRDTLMFNDKGRRIDAGVNNPQRQGFDYRRYMGLPGVPGQGGGSNMALPPSNAAPPSAPPEPSVGIPQPGSRTPGGLPETLSPSTRRDPTAARRLPANN